MRSVSGIAKIVGIAAGAVTLATYKDKGLPPLVRVHHLVGLMARVAVSFLCMIL